jgi:hypothetical protein
MTTRISPVVTRNQTLTLRLRPNLTVRKYLRSNK